MSRFVLCNCPAGFAADPERHAPDCPGRSGAGKPSLLPPGKPFTLIGAGPGRTPRPGREYWDRLNSLPRYMFLLRPSGSGVQKLEDPTGNWIDAHEAQKVVEAAQDDLNGLRAELYLAQAREAALTTRLEQKITEIIDEATKAIEAYRKEAALQERLNIADQRVEELQGDAGLLSLLLAGIKEQRLVVYKKEPDAITYLEDRGAIAWALGADVRQGEPV